jgi:hypothetical protein
MYKNTMASNDVIKIPQMDCNKSTSGFQAFGNGLLNGFSGMVGIHVKSDTNADNYYTQVSSAFSKIKSEWATRLQSDRDKLSQEKINWLQSQINLSASRQQLVDENLEEQVQKNTVDITYLFVFVAILVIYNLIPAAE